MAGRRTRYAEALHLRFLFRRQAYSPPIAYYLALCTSPPTDATPGTEVTAVGYVRRALNNVLASWSEPDPAAPGETHYLYTVTFKAMAAPVTVTHGELWDALTAGNRLFWGPFTDAAGSPTPVTIPKFHRLRLKAHTIRIRED
jgi:hypothetical protein